MSDTNLKDIKKIYDALLNVEKVLNETQLEIGVNWYMGPWTFTDVLYDLTLLRQGSDGYVYCDDTTTIREIVEGL